MNADFLRQLITANLPTLAAIACNGEFRVVTMRDVVQTDSRGFPDSDYVPESQAFSECSWTARRAAEVESGQVVRSLDIYEITAAIRGGDGISRLVNSGIRIELRLMKNDSEVKTLEVISVVNQGGVAWIVRAVEAQ